MVVFFQEYRRTRTLQPYEVIVMLLVVSSILLELVSVSWLVIYFLNLCLYVGEVFYQVSDTFILFFPKLIVWFTASLCLVYCVKIVKVNWSFFLKLKQKISLVVKFMIFLTLLICAFISIPVHSVIKFNFNATNVCREYFILQDETKNSPIYSFLISTLTSFLPLIIMLISSLGIVIFLFYHLRNMDKNAIPSNTSRNDAHTSVAIMLICLIALFVVCAGTALSVNIQIALGQLDIAPAITITQLLYSAGSPVILIVGMVKLRKRFMNLCCSKG
ncbi:taste receptor type 2 member 3-like [Latimeria chalumnae]|nr:PREDICTED: taste receptor type 2 member 3-like [Latimeria chalumnae]|eukprot:XP_006013620.2 PREDICTED: taste receptor type 2 member 3-like [Latimeria chalumnae]